MDTKTFVFEFKDVEFALVKSGGFSYFEAEILEDKESHVKECLEKIKNACKEMGIEIFQDKEFTDLINKMNQRKDRKFNMREQTFEEIRERFKEYF